MCTNSQTKKWILSLLFIILASSASAVTERQFNNSLISENLTFVGSQNITRYFDIFRYANITSATLNLSGGTLNEYETFNAIDNWTSLAGTWAITNGVLNGSHSDYSVIYRNSTNTTYEDYAEIQAKVQAVGGNDYGLAVRVNSGSDFYYVLASQSGNAIRFGIRGQAFLCGATPYFTVAGITHFKVSLNGSTYRIWANDTDFVFNGDPLVTCTDTTYRGGFIGFTAYNMRILADNVTINGSAQNPYLEIGTADGTREWSFNLFFNQEHNMTGDLRQALNSSLSGGSCSGGQVIDRNCSIPFLFHSDTLGSLQFSDLRINWLEYVRPNLTILSPVGTVSSRFITVSLNATDNHQLAECYFNITRGSSLEISNINMMPNCSSYSTEVSGDATYMLWVYLKDYSGNVNATNASFTVSGSGQAAGSSSGGGGGGGGNFAQDILDKLTADKEVIGSVCTQFKPAFDQAWQTFRDDPSSENLGKLWTAFWDYILCRSAASIAPV